MVAWHWRAFPFWILHRILNSTETAEHFTPRYEVINILGDKHRSPGQAIRGRGVGRNEIGLKGPTSSSYRLEKAHLFPVKGGRDRSAQPAQPGWPLLSRPTQRIGYRENREESAFQRPEAASSPNAQLCTLPQALWHLGSIKAATQELLRDTAAYFRPSPMLFAFKSAGKSLHFPPHTSCLHLSFPH